MLSSSPTIPLSPNSPFAGANLPPSERNFTLTLKIITKTIVIAKTQYMKNWLLKTLL